MADAEIVLMGDPRVAAIPVDGSDEPLVDVGAIDRLLIDERKSSPGGEWRLVRSGVASRLARAAAALPDGMALLHVEGHRAPAVQARYFAEYREQLRSAEPSRTDEALDALASRYVSPPHIAPHCAGAAVDLTLATSDGEELDLGTAVNDSPETSAGRCFTAADVPARARRHRDLLAGVLEAAGLVNYPTEWWHWSYGDRYWALLTGRPAAHYDEVR